MPALSPTMTQGNIARWKVQEGDEVRAGDSVAEIETDKATMEFESQEDGYVAKICVGDGAQNVPVGAIVAVMVEEKEHVGAFASYVPPAVNAAATDAPPAATTPTQSSSSSTSSSTTTTRTDESGGRMWPSVRRLLAESGIDPLAITPTGPRGMLVKGGRPRRHGTLRRARRSPEYDFDSDFGSKRIQETGFKGGSSGARVGRRHVR